MTIMFSNVVVKPIYTGGGRNVATLTLNPDISITVTAMTLSFYDFS